MAELNVLTFEEVGTSYVHRASQTVSSQYWSYGVTPEDVSQEIQVWLYRREGKVREWLASEPQRKVRIYRAMLDEGYTYAEREKAARVGYNVDDVWWYTAKSVEGLMPLVLDPTYVEGNGQVGELITMVVDIRRVMSVDDFKFFLHNDSTSLHWKDRLRSIVDRLGGSRPYVGRRKVLSNATAQAITNGDVE